jgi:hypothetical protein
VEVVALLRDIAIIVLAVETIVIGLMVLLLVWQLWRLVGFVRRHLDTLVGSANGILGTVKDGAESVADTAQDVKSTAGYVTARTVIPVVEFYSVMNGARRFAEAVFRPKPPARPHRTDGDGGERG